MRYLTVKNVSPILIVVSAIALGNLLSAPKAAPTKTELTARVPMVKVQRIQRRNLHATVASQGLVTPKHETPLSAEVQGKVSMVAPQFMAGGFIKAGELLAQIEPGDYESDVEAAQAALARAKAALELEQVRAGMALTERKNDSKLKASRSGLRKPQLDQAMADVASARTVLDKAKRRLARTRIVAPYDSIIQSRNINSGQYLSEGMAVGVLLSTASAEVRLPISVSDAEYLDIHRHSEKTVLSVTMKMAGQQFESRVVRSEGVVDPATRMLYLVAEIKDPYRLSAGNGTHFPFGSYVKARIKGRLLPEAVLIPDYALDGGRLWLMGENRELQPLAIDVVGRQDDYVLVRGELNNGDLVSLTRLPYPTAGMSVMVDDDASTALTDNHPERFSISEPVIEKVQVQ
ncbi:MAG: efflux RND transporter periplasmic adaptor subunit [Candidatus Thiodiazotropha sp. (ex Rostrolucina anterorostrata)]|nr:efflux RND transporter periplasmic adaptor subunit [Candidatus Thiodiazotropha sp. (ex Rostrolucina anterorostrata)]